MGNRTYHPRGELIDGHKCDAHPLHSTWASMLSRCTNPKDPSYRNYGARGITVCRRWHHFKNFVIDMGDKPSCKHSLERKDVDGPYTKSNCKWATASEQALNRRMFSNNTSGETGVVDTGFSFEARFDYGRVRYNIGRFGTIVEARAARVKFIAMFFKNKSAAAKSLDKETVWRNSCTKVRGVTPHVDGGYMARCTINGKRHYVGYFQTVNEAKHARLKFIESNAR